MKITFLGRGAAEGIPALFCECKLCRQARERKIYRTRSQLLVNHDLLIEFPPDSYYRALNLGVNLAKIENVLITHSHTNSFYCEDFFMRGLLSSFGLTSPTVVLHGNSVVCDILERNDCAKQKGAYERKVQGRFNGYDIFGQSSEYVLRRAYETFTAGKYTVTALPTEHMRDEECFVYLVSDGEKTILYAADSAYFPSELIEYLTEKHVILDALVLDGTYGLVDNDNAHMNFFENDKLRKELMRLGIVRDKTKCFVTHVFHGAAKDLDALDKAVPDGFTLPIDGDAYEL